MSKLTTLTSTWRHDLLLHAPLHEFYSKESSDTKGTNDDQFSNISSLQKSNLYDRIFKRYIYNLAHDLLYLSYFSLLALVVSLFILYIWDYDFVLHGKQLYDNLVIPYTRPINNRAHIHARFCSAWKTILFCRMTFIIIIIYEFL